MFGELPIQIYLSVRERKNKNKIFISQEKKTHRICLSVLTFTRAVKYGLFVFYVIMLCLYNDARTPMSLILVFIQLHSLVKHDLWKDAIFSMKLKLQFQVFWVFKWMYGGVTWLDKGAKKSNYFTQAKISRISHVNCLTDILVVHIYFIISKICFDSSTILSEYYDITHWWLKR